MNEMGMRPLSFGPEEWYHCYNRGVDKRSVFEIKYDYRRFSELLYLCNSEVPIHRSNFDKENARYIFEIERDNQLVSIGAYCLMPNHFHLLLKNVNEDGISRFMQKLGTAYTMYFNISRERVGNLFVKPFRARHVADDRYLQRVVQYIHLNPTELFESGWKKGNVHDTSGIIKRLKTYMHSSLPDYEGMVRPESAILSLEMKEFLAENLPPLESLIEESVEYYASLTQ
ncbi:MAG: transposase [bacterium]|nr:transposase [bacterium]